MKKNDLIFNLSERLNLSKIDAKISVEVILDTLTHGIISGKGIEVRGFGRLGRKHRKARLGINPKTGEKIQVSEKFSAYFKPGKPLRKAVDYNKID